MTWLLGDPPRCPVSGACGAGTWWLVLGAPGYCSGSLGEGTQGHSGGLDDPACGVPCCPPQCPIGMNRALTSWGPQVRSSDPGDTGDSQEAWEVTGRELGEAGRGMLALLQSPEQAGNEWRRALCVCVSFFLSFKTFEDKCFIHC